MMVLSNYYQVKDYENVNHGPSKICLIIIVVEV